MWTWRIKNRDIWFIKMKTKTELAIENYEQVCLKVYGKLPKLERSGSWIYINDSPTAHRISKLDEYADNLLKTNAYEKTFNLEDSEFGDPKELKDILKTLNEIGRAIFLSKNFKWMQNKGNVVAKFSKRALNILEKEE